MKGIKIDMASYHGNNFVMKHGAVENANKTGNLS